MPPVDLFTFDDLSPFAQRFAYNDECGECRIKDSEEAWNIITEKLRSFGEVFLEDGRRPVGEGIFMVW